jgi:hypothetical protein
MWVGRTSGNTQLERLIMESSTHIVPVDCISDLQKKIDKLNRKAVKIGTTPITLTLGDKIILSETYDHEWVVRTADDKRRFGPRTVECQEVTVAGEAPKYDGWMFIATLEPVGDKNLIRAIEGIEGLSAYRETVGICEHCNKTRRRNDTYVVQHNDGTRKVVGKSCLKDFLGHTNPNQLAAWAAMILQLEEIAAGYADEDAYERCGTSSWPLEEFLPAVSGCIRANGWASRTAAKENFGTVSTADQVLYVLQMPHGEKRNKAYAEIAPSQREIDRASAALQWCQDGVDFADNDYLMNLNVIAQAGSTTAKQAGYAASMLIAHAKFEDRELERKKRDERPESHHIGNIGERLEMTLTCERIHEVESDYGCSGIHKLVDQDGNDLTWFASGSATWIDEGETVTVKATVKKHDEFRGRKQTIVNRVKEVKVPATV